MAGRAEVGRQGCRARDLLSAGPPPVSPGAAALLVVSLTVTCWAAPQAEDPWLQVLNGSGQEAEAGGGGQEAEERQDTLEPGVEAEAPVQQLQPQPPPPQRPQVARRPQRPRPRPRPQGPRGQGRPQRRPRPRPNGPGATPAPGLFDPITGFVKNVACTGSNLITDAKLRDTAFIRFQLDCARGAGPCDDMGKKIKSEQILQICLFVGIFH
jgi:hypothetical protein